jgi:archaemetzincin
MHITMGSLWAIFALLLALIAVGGCAERQAVKKSAPEGSPEVRIIRAAGDAIRPLHTAMGKPKPGEWLDQHPEPGQTFDAYLTSSPNRPDVRRTTIYLQPLGDFDTAQENLLAATVDLLGRFYGTPVKRLDKISMEAIPASARRVHPKWGDRQILTTFVLDLLKQRRPDDAVAVLALTAADLWPGENWNFVFGQASLGDRVGVWSIYRLGNPRTEPATCLLRTLKVAVHETGHMMGIPHCTPYECGMNGSNHIVENDERPLWFCPEDEMKVWWACRVDPKARYASLVEFGQVHGLDREAKFWKASLDALNASQPSDARSEVARP